MSIADKLQTIAENEQRVYQAGYNEGAASGGSGGVQQEWFNDGNTHIWVRLPEGRTSPRVGLAIKGTATIDWGDGTEPELLTGTSTAARAIKFTPNHNYATPGDYIITIAIDGEAYIAGKGTQETNGAMLLSYTSTSAAIENKTYRMAIRKIEMGSGITGTTQNPFTNCYALESVMYSPSVISIRDEAFYDCYFLSKITIPKSVIEIYSNAFTNCSNMKCYDFTQSAAVPTLIDANAFTGIPADCEILVPSALYNEWVAATNWATYASYIKAV